MNWTKIPHLYGMAYCHNNGTILVHSSAGMWTAYNDDWQGGVVPEFTAMTCLASALRSTAMCEEVHNKGKEPGDATYMPVHLTIEQLVECINDLHTGGLP
jgi:hypothetical protein